MVGCVWRVLWRVYVAWRVRVRGRGVRAGRRALACRFQEQKKRPFAELNRGPAHYE